MGFCAMARFRILLPSRRMVGFLLPFSFVLGISPPLLAGTICGIVRDTSSGAPVANAGVFVRETSGGYTGLHTASDGSGFYCIEDIPPGTYDLECRVDDYLAAFVRDVVVTDTQVGVGIDITPSRLRLSARPNPASTRVILEFSSRTPNPIRIEIFDLQGRRLRGWEGEGGRTHIMNWSFRDNRGRPVPAGIYFARLSTGGHHRTVRILRIP